MSDDNFIVDKLGWVDDFRALPGQCGTLLTRKIYLYSLLRQGTSIDQLRQMGFSKELILEMNNQMINEIFGEEPEAFDGNR